VRIGKQWPDSVLVAGDEEWPAEKEQDDAEFAPGEDAATGRCDLLITLPHVRH